MSPHQNKLDSLFPRVNIHVCVCVCKGSETVWRADGIYDMYAALVLFVFDLN